MPEQPAKTAEELRLDEKREEGVPWHLWGPYLSERQWGTVREDYSDNGDAWAYFSHDQARSRAYHWGEDGIAGISDDRQLLCFALALWNGKDPILKERLFGLTNAEGNHGEDVKEYYFYLDNTPTHSYMKYLYKYPQNAYPYSDLVETSRRRGRDDWEYELLDTGIFSDDRYFDVLVEYAKTAPNNILIRITVCNRGPEAAELHLLPTLWFRNTWSWWPEQPKPSLRQAAAGAVAASHPELGDYVLHCDGDPRLLFTENETNNERLFGTANPTPHVKDGINDFVVARREEAVNPGQTGTKAAAHYRLNVAPGATAAVRLRLAPGDSEGSFGDQFDQAVEERGREADAFYRAVTPSHVGEDAANVMRQALSGMLWTKQYFFFDVDKWLDEHGVDPLRFHTRQIRNHEWSHMISGDIFSMPDKWEYPWFAAWDLAFHAMALSPVDIDFAKHQLNLLLDQVYLHPTGQIPAYEWNFSDVNPPVQAWATIFLYRMEQALRGRTDLDFLKRMFGKLSANFGWWINRKDRTGNNLYEGGFLGLDNIGVFDRSAPLPTGGYLEQADGTAWVALFCQNMLEIACELSAHDPTYQDLASNFARQFLLIARALNGMGADGMWDEEDGFYYDVLRLPDGSATRLRVRSMVGLLPLCATTIVEPTQRAKMPRLTAQYQARLQHMPELRELIHPTGPGDYGVGGRGIIALVNQDRLRRILTRMLDENEFLSPYGIRSLSRWHAEHPYVFTVKGREYRVAYLPAESDSGMFGGNSNWRGPIWMPVNALIIRALMHYFSYYGDNFKIACPTGSGRLMNLFEVAREIADRLTGIFLRDENGRRPVYGGAEKFQTDPHWRDHLLFYEYFHGDNGAGIGAGHQTGWTGMVAGLIEIFGKIDAQTFLAAGASATFGREDERLRGRAMPRYPSLLQINSRVWIERLSRVSGRRLTLAEIDDATIGRFAEQGFDWVWLLSVWQTGAAGRAVSRGTPQWRAEFEAALPDLTEDDICGSGFAITGYGVNERLGGETALAGFRERLAARGIRLMLDFVPNHTAPDHPWVKAHPDYYAQGSEAALAAAPQNYLRVETERGTRILAHGRDPNFPGWPDTLQLDYANPELQGAQIDELGAVAGKCDGVRCDMAMLLLPEVFERTWGRRPEPFWPKAIAAVHARHPGFTFMAEVYWDLEWTLQQQGFDYCYDKRLYDRLRAGDAGAIRGHLRAGLDYQDKLARFLENHDEPRAAAEFSWPQHRAAAVASYFSPGLRFFQDGQRQGARVRIPAHLCRGPVEPTDPEADAFYQKLLAALNGNPALRDGAWSQIEPRAAWPGNPTADGFVAYAWAGAGESRHVVVVNYTGHQGQCRLPLPFPELRGRRVQLTDVIGREAYDRDGGELVDPGLFIDHRPWQYNLFALHAS